MIALQGARAGYAGAPDALRGITARFPDGRAVALLGENGSGKSTLLKLLAGILPPRAGSVTLGERPLASVPRREAAALVGYLAQGFEPLFPARALEVVLLGRTPHLGLLSSPSAADRERALAALAEMDAAHLAQTDLLAMSGGERQRVLMARVLAGDTPLLLLDEPSASLDPRHRFLVAERIRARTAAGAAVVFSTHELDLAASAADDALLLRGGELVAFGPLREVLTGEAMRSLFQVPARVVETDAGRPSILLG